MTIGKQEFSRRRKALMEMMEPNSIAILPSGRERTRSRDTDYFFRQDSDFYYLTGFTEPDAVLVLIPEREHGEFVLFCRDRDPEKEIWDGYRAGPEGAIVKYGADDAFPIDDIDEILSGLIEGRQRLYYAMGRDADFDKHVMDWVNRIRAKVRSGATPPGEFLDLDHILHDMRLYKSAAEIRLMEEAGRISAEAHIRAMRACKPGVYEYQLEAEIRHECAMQGAREQAYNPIVGGGKNACILHYVENTDKLKNGDLVLIDAGGEYQGYAADITRTFPVNGVFSKEQADIYRVVLRAQAAAMEKIVPGNHWNEPHDASVAAITQGLIDLGLLQGDLGDNIERETFKTFYMHRIGHWLGLDVHDVGDYKVGDEWRVLEPGMVMTVEPGIYISPDNEHVAKKWRGIGIRIEDDVLITKDGYRVLTDNAPRTIEEIEALMAQA
ncbi:Xaa-Pro aminopeptidase [Teredinibacter sp. KSP-S5-2]|uniref:Xaa-Pro aminopeptidase n=1 Tax=Teredinibacter sp. KSP-S5-2 TaxID=3034506 RepID=UPI0029347B04|nr:Xaa-Pro aminopeptidase [Teredinibacter sp. KSP-S5-2]WNO08837.1 Xaa-Pro aminopeptidase [Teredinibacter sp. KSP-S5-2]